MYQAHAVWWFDGAEPLGAIFWDTRLGAYISIQDGIFKEYCPVTEVWYTLRHCDVLQFHREYPLVKNPKVSWRKVQKELKDSLVYLRLFERAVELKPRLPFMRLRTGVVVTKSRYLGWFARLYLCYFRGFVRYPGVDGFYFVKNLKGEG